MLKKNIITGFLVVVLVVIIGELAFHYHYKNLSIKDKEGIRANIAVSCYADEVLPFMKVCSDFMGKIGEEFYNKLYLLKDGENIFYRNTSIIKIFTVDVINSNEKNLLDELMNEIENNSFYYMENYKAKKLFELKMNKLDTLIRFTHAGYPINSDLVKQFLAFVELKINKIENTKIESLYSINKQVETLSIRDDKFSKLNYANVFVICVIFGIFLTSLYSVTIELINRKKIKT